QEYNDALEIPPGAQVAAFVASLNAKNYISSFAASAKYDAEKVQLGPPVIAASNPVIGYGDIPHSSTVTLTTDVPPSIGRISYSTDGGLSWNSYLNPFPIDISSFPGGAEVRAKIVAAVYQEYYLESEAVVAVIKAQLQSPQFSLASQSCCEDLYDTTLDL